MATTGENTGTGQGVGLAVGSKIGKYEVVERSGIGGQAIVYKCYDRMLDRFVAAKQISPHMAEDPKFVERFRREAQILAKLGAEGTSIVAIHDLLEESAGLFIVMEFVQGHTLETILHDTNGPTEPKAALQILWRLAAALHVVHAAGIIHRDLKPSNIIIAEGLHPKITDFGVAASRTGQTSMLLGTTKYMAPELFVGGEVDGRADLYSLGMIAYELLLGRPRFNQAFDEIVRDPHSEALRWMKWHSNEEVSAPALHTLDPSIPEGLSEIVAKMMAKSRPNRFESMEALGRAIRTSFSPRGKAAGGAPAVGPPGARPKGPRALAAAGAGAGAAMAEADGDELDIHAPPPTPPNPHKPMTLRTKLVLAGVAFAMVLTGVIILVVHAGGEARAQAAAASALYRAADANYTAGKFEDVLVLFDGVSAKYPGTAWAAKAGVMSPLTRSRIAERDANAPEEWEYVEREEKAAEDQAKNLQTATKDKDLSDWVRGVLNQIDDRRRNRPDLRQFRVAMALAKEAFEAGQFDKVAEIVEQISRAGLSTEQKKQCEELSLAAKRAGFAKSFTEDLARADQLASLSEPKKPMDYDSTKKAYDITASILLQTGGGVLPPAEMEAKDKLLRDRLTRLENKRKYQDALKKVALAATPQAKIQADLELQAAEALVGLPTDATALAIKLARAEMFMQQAQTAYDASKFTEARQRAQDAMREVPNYPPAVAMIAKLDSGDNRKLLITKGDAASAQGKFDEALKFYQDALKLAADQALSAKITECQVQILFLEADQLVKDEKYDEAIVALEKARKLDPSKASIVDSREAIIRTIKEVRALMAEGDKAMEAGDFAVARRTYAKAAAKGDSAVLQTKIALASYSENVKLGKDAMAAKQGDVARAYFLQAKKYVEKAGLKPDEIDKLIRDAEDLINLGPKP